MLCIWVVLANWCWLKITRRWLQTKHYQRNWESFHAYTTKKMPVTWTVSASPTRGKRSRISVAVKSNSWKNNLWIWKNAIKKSDLGRLVLVLGQATLNIRQPHSGNARRYYPAQRKTVEHLCTGEDDKYLGNTFTFLQNYDRFHQMKKLYDETRNVKCSDGK